MKRVNFYLGDEQLAALQGVQKRRGVPVSAQIRHAVDEYLKCENHYPLPPANPNQLELFPEAPAGG